VEREREYIRVLGNSRRKNWVAIVEVKRKGISVFLILTLPIRSSTEQSSKISLNFFYFLITNLLSLISYLLYYKLAPKTYL
jgi:hypothetical protein